MVDVFNAKLQKYYERRKKVKFNPKQITEIELKKIVQEEKRPGIALSYSTKTGEIRIYSCRENTYFKELRKYEDNDARRPEYPQLMLQFIPLKEAKPKVAKRVKEE